MPTVDVLGRIGSLLTDGGLKLPIAATYDLADAPAALTDLGEKHTQGKARRPRRLVPGED